MIAHERHSLCQEAHQAAGILDIIKVGTSTHVIGKLQACADS